MLSCHLLQSTGQRLSLNSGVRTSASGTGTSPMAASHPPVPARTALADHAEALAGVLLPWLFVSAFDGL